MNKSGEANKREAIALSYSPESQTSPRVLAKGKGMTAENIIQRAKENGIPIQEDPALANLLGQLEISSTIPEELYAAVAEVFAFIYRADRAAGNRKPPPND
jgi:flagellar biosynthesis protein